MKKFRKNEPCVRKCIVTNERFQKDELIRIVKKDGIVSVDASGAAEGRGAYISANAELIKKAVKKNPLARAFRMNVDAKVYDELLKLVGDRDE